MNVERNADLYIFARDYENTTRISKVLTVSNLSELSSLTSGCIGNLREIGELYSREQIIDLLRNDKLIMTAYWDIDGFCWSEGNVVEIFGGEFIRSVSDETKRDNLGEICDIDFIK